MADSIDGRKPSNINNDISGVDVEAPYEDKEYDSKFKTLDDVLEEKIEPVTYLVDGLIVSRSINVLSGEPASFKTWALYQLALDVTAGKKFLGHFATAQTGVVILDAEMDTMGFQSCMMTLGAEKNLPIYYLSATGDELSTEKCIDKLMAFCASKGTGLVIVDSLTRFHTGDENSSQAMSAVFRLLHRLKRGGLTVIIIHHDKKGGNIGFGGRGGNALRGSSDIAGAADNIIRMRRQDGSNEVLFEQVKSRGFVEHKPFKAKFYQVSEEHSQWEFIGEEISKEDRLKKDKRALLQYIKEHSGLNKKTLFNKINNTENNLELPANKFYKMLDEMEKDGDIRYEKGERTEQLIYPIEDFTSEEGESQNA